MSIPLISLGFVIWFLSRTLYVVEIYEDKIKFKKLFCKYTIQQAQIRDIEMEYQDLTREKVFVLKVDGYERGKNRYSYPFQFVCNRKTQELVQKIWVDIQLRQSDEQ